MILPAGSYYKNNGLLELDQGTSQVKTVDLDIKQP